jgi:hypothetical protein
MERRSARRAHLLYLRDLLSIDPTVERLGFPGTIYFALALERALGLPAASALLAHARRRTNTVYAGCAIGCAALGLLVNLLLVDHGVAATLGIAVLSLSIGAVCGQVVRVRRIDRLIGQVDGAGIVSCVGARKTRKVLREHLVSIPARALANDAYREQLRLVTGLDPLLWEDALLLCGEYDGSVAELCETVSAI